MIRWMISPVVLGNVPFPNTYAAAVSFVPNVNSAALIPTHIPPHVDAGKPKYGFALYLVATSNIAAVEAVSNAYVFPEYNLDGRMDGMNAAARNGFEQSVEAYNLDGQGLHFDASHTDAESYREVITRIGQQMEPAFSINALNVGEVAQ